MTDQPKEKKTFAGAVLKYFGRKEGQTPQDFAAEIRQLTPEDRAEMKPLLEQVLLEEQGLNLDITV